MIYAPMTEEEEPAVAELEATAFAFQAAEAPDWFARAGRENMRVLRDDGGIAAALMLVPMGQFFAGRSLSTLGIAAVAVALERRQQKLGRRLMAETLREANERGFALSTLYPATRTLYRSVGYELAGRLSDIAVHSSRLELAACFEPLTIRPITSAIEPLTEALYLARAREQHGFLDRGPYIWGRVRRPRKGTCRGFAFFDGDQLLAYTYFVQEQNASGHDHDVFVKDFVATSARGYAALFDFYRSQRSLLDTLHLTAGARAPYLALLREPRADESTMLDWMIRIVSLPSAIEGRGYPSGASLSIAVDVRDELLPSNAGTWTLSVQDGVASATRGGSARAAFDIRAFVPIFAGYYSATEARRLGQIECADDHACALLDAMFASPMAGMSEMF